ADSFGNEAYSTKIMEFMSLGVPVVISRTRIDQFYFDDSVVRFFESGNPEALAKAMLDLISDPDGCRAMVPRASMYAARNNWETRKKDYLALVDSLITGEDFKGGMGDETTLEDANGSIVQKPDRQTEDARLAMK